MRRVIKHRTTDAKLCGCSRYAGASTCDKCAPKSNPITDQQPALRVDLNEIHRRFWARLAGKE